MLVAMLRLLGQAAFDESHEGTRQPGHPRAHRLRILLEHLVQDRVHGVGVERLLAREQLVEHGPQREDVGAGIGLGAPHLLGGHVVRRAHHHPGAGHLRGADAGQAEVHDLDAPVGQDADVGGLEVAVHDPLLVRVGQPFRDLLHHVELVPQVVEAPGGDQLLEVGPVEQLHGQVELALLAAEIEDGDDVRMVEARGGLRLAVEPLDELVVGGVELGHRLDRDVTVQRPVVGAIDVAHGPRANLGDDQVLADLLAFHRHIQGGPHRERTPLSPSGYPPTRSRRREVAARRLSAACCLPAACCSSPGSNSAHPCAQIRRRARDGSTTDRSASRLPLTAKRWPGLHLPVR